jgi:inhibitor of cysteine peptidase
MQNKFFKTAFILFSLGIILVGMVGCSPKPVQLTEADNGTSVSMSVGSQLVVTLPGNPSTGFNWEVKSVDASILELAGDPQFVSDNTNIMGAGGALTFTFDAKIAGSTTLELIYHRPFETGVDPLQTFSVKVEVK